MYNTPDRIPSVVVVEDDSEIAELLKIVLGDAYAVDCVGDAPAALARLEHEPPDIILLDCLLPGGRRSAVLERAKALRCVVVPMSGSPEVLLELQAFGYPCLQKPFKLAELVETIEAARSRQGDARQ